MILTTFLRLIGWGLLLAGALHLGSFRTGQLPPLGQLLDPVHGIWGVARHASFAEAESVELAGMSSPVTVVFDDRAVPHIFAATREDAARAVGYVTARDRLFQMELRWRTTAGRLSEIVGDGALELDRGMRGIGLAWSAERHFARLDPDSPIHREIVAYGEGVNAWIDGMRRSQIPFEYHILGARPSRWEPIYSIYLVKLMGWDLSFSMATDLKRLRARARVGKEATDALFPINSPIQQPIQPNGQREPRFAFSDPPPPGAPDLDAARSARALEMAFGSALAGIDEEQSRVALGSNNWAVAAWRTAGGHALLAGDPHLALTLPSTWYEVQLSVPGKYEVYGVTFPSVPFPPIGFNRDVAWSFTNTGADIIDYYEERLDSPDSSSRYLLDGKWRELERRVETYRGRGNRVIASDTLYFTHRGPGLADLGRTLSMRWAVLDGGGEVEALADIGKAKSVDEWLEILKVFGSPAQNGVVADRDGWIAIRSTGDFPIHPDGDGLEIEDGTTRASDWRGFWPLERYPFSLNPEQGYLASANQQPIDPADEPDYLGADWPSPWRAIRINQLLAGDSAVTPDAMRRFQTDPGNARADFFVPYFLNAVSALGEQASEKAREGARLLGEWDRLYTKENERAVLFEYAMNSLAELTWDELRVDAGIEELEPAPTPSSTILANLLAYPSSPWWDDRGTEALEDRDAILTASLEAGLARAHEEHGEPEAGRWRWDGIRHANIWHVLGLAPLSLTGVPLQGGPGNLNPSSGRGTHGSSWRMVVEMAPSVRAWTIYPGGQSGNPVSTYYDDRIRKWSEGRLEEALFPRSPEEMPAERMISTLVLTPEGSR